MLPCGSAHVVETKKEKRRKKKKVKKKFATNSGEALAATCSSRTPRQNSRPNQTHMALVETREAN